MDIRKYFIINNDNNKQNNVSVKVNNNNNENNKNNENNDNKQNNVSVNVNENENENKNINNIFFSNNYVVYTDGSAFNNGIKNKPQSGGIGIYFGENEDNISEKLFGKITNNIAELKACIKGIEIIVSKKIYNNNKKIIIFTDSSYVINSITKWAKNWEKNNWQKYDIRKKKYNSIKNQILIQKLYNLYKKYKIEFTYIKAHTSGNNLDKNSLEYKHWFGNYNADKLAVNASKKK